MKTNDLTRGSITKGLWYFALPLMVGNIFQQFYNLVDTYVVGRYVGELALAAVGTSYTFMTFITSVIIGLCMGHGTYVSMAYGREDDAAIRNSIFITTILISLLTIGLTIGVLSYLDTIIALLQTPFEVRGGMYTYLWFVVLGLMGSFLYNHFAMILRGLGNSVVPLIFLILSILLNVVLDIYFVVVLHMAIKGVAMATVISQYISGIGLMMYFYYFYPQYRVKKEDCHLNRDRLNQTLQLSFFTSLQQATMNLGILCVQGIVNRFGSTVMAAFSIAVKIDTLAYMPVQDFGNAFSVFVAQNYGAKKQERIREGIRKAAQSVVIFCLVVSVLVCLLAPSLMAIFTQNKQVIQMGVQYLRVEGSFYVGIGILFMLYGYYRAINHPQMSVVLTVISLGTRVVLAYSCSRWMGPLGIWIAIPIGWILADVYGILYGIIMKRKE